MQFKFSKKVTIVCSIFVLLMLRASYWQYTRYLEKTAYIKELMQRLELPIEDATTAAASANGDWTKLLHRRLSFRGTWDYEHETVLRNRKYNEIMGGFLLTPLKTDLGTFIVSRGFIPLQLLDKDNRKKFQTETSASFVGLVKESNPGKFLAPSDPPAGDGNPWVDQWLRVDLDSMQHQLPTPILPVYLERLPANAIKITESELLISKSNRDEIFMPGAGAKLTSYDDVPEGDFPVPMYDTVVPAGRHFSYIFEWGIMAMMTIIIGLILQLKRSA